MKFLQALSRFTLGLALMVMSYACAKVGSLDGGPKDIVPPQVVKERSTRNFSTRFAERKITMVFNEWITLTDVFNQVVISPPLAQKLDVALKGKTVTFNFEPTEVLRPNTTYTINFGNAVKDFTEGNPAKDLRFVFSTGDFIDSLKISGMVVDAFTEAPVENISVLLYDKLEDSVAVKERPYYFAKTDKSGQFTINNVRPGVFKVVAIDDVNLKLMWAGNQARIGFLDIPISVQDTASAPINIKIFKPNPTLRMDKEVSRYGLARLSFPAPLDSTLTPVSTTQGVRLLTERYPDTLFVWYDWQTAPMPWSFVVGSDSVKLRAFSREDFIKNHKLRYADEAPPKVDAAKGRGRPNTTPAPAAALPVNTIKTITQNPQKPLVLDFNFPIVGIDTAKWLLQEDSSTVRLRAFGSAPDSLLPRKVNLSTTWRNGKNYALTLLPGAVTDFFGVQNTDTLRRKINVLNEKQLGGLNVTAKNLKPNTYYVFQLINGNIVTEERRWLATGAEQRIVLTNLNVGNYSARLIEDANGNGRWDPGNYFAHRQPEPVFSKTLEPLRANWELEISIAIGGVQEKEVKKRL